MPLFQCENCGCAESSVLSNGYALGFREIYDWEQINDRRQKKLCSACMPRRFTDGFETGYGTWHEVFERIFLEPGKWKTNEDGNLQHVITGCTNYQKNRKAKPPEPLPKPRTNRGRRR